MRCHKWLASQCAISILFHDICNFLCLKHKYLKTRGHSCRMTHFAQHLWHVSSFSPEGWETAWTGFCEIPAARRTIFPLLWWSPRSSLFARPCFYGNQQKCGESWWLCGWRICHVSPASAILIFDFFLFPSGSLYWWQIFLNKWKI